MIEKRNQDFENVILIGVITQEQDEDKSKEYLDELEFLTITAGGKVVKRFTQKLDYPNPKTFVGTGKLDEIRTYIDNKNIQTVIFDDELMPSQLRNIEKLLECKVLDRTNLILDIFAQRAQTSYARTQVELAQCQYLLPRLTRMWTHLKDKRVELGYVGQVKQKLKQIEELFEIKFLY